MVYIKKAVRKQVWDRAKGNCEECGAGHSLEIHHMIPRSRDGTNDISNLQLLCEKCHTEKKVSNWTHKGNLVNINEVFTIEEFQKLLRSKGKLNWHDFILSLT